MTGRARAASDTARPLLVISNRLPFTVSRTSRGLERQPSSGGLVTALKPVLEARGGTWVGWPGISLREGERLERGDESYEISPVAR